MVSNRENPFGQVLVALVTPFAADGEVDWADVEKHIDDVITAGADGIVVTGTTGETSTLTDPEKLKRFVSFVNAPDTPDPTITFVDERGQIRPATEEERAAAQAKALTGEISQALNSGKHTTTATTWYWVEDGRETALIDSPGFQDFGLHHIPPMQLASLMPDFKPHVPECRFYNCTHLHEPGCGVRAAANSLVEAACVTASRVCCCRSPSDMAVT